VLSLQKSYAFVTKKLIYTILNKTTGRLVHGGLDLDDSGSLEPIGAGEDVHKPTSVVSHLTGLEGPQI
jgi:hypothetical protein